MKIKKGDKIQVTLGKDKGRTGVVKKVFTKKGLILVEGINIVKKHVKAEGEKKKGGIVKIEKPFDSCKAMVVCPKCNKATRIGFQVSEKSKDKMQKYRICKKCELARKDNSKIS